MSTAPSHAGLDLRPYNPAMVSEMIGVWNAALGGAFPLSEALFRQNATEDPHFDPAGCWVACESGHRVRGFSVAKVAREPIGADGLLEDRGWISMIAVHPSFQRRGFGTALLLKAEEFLRSRRRSRAILGGDPGHFFPGVPVETTPGPAAGGSDPSSRESAALAFFTVGGYRIQGEAYDLRRSLGAYRTPPRVDAALAAQKGVEVRPIRPGEEQSLLAFLDAVFPGRWRYTLGRFLDGGGEIGDVMGVLQRGAVLGFAHLFHPASRWIGPSIAWTGQGRSRAGGLGPMGLAPALRGRGLGLTLLDRSVQHLARLGVDEMIIDWTVLLDFYGQLGFIPLKRYRHGERKL